MFVFNQRILWLFSLGSKLFLNYPNKVRDFCMCVFMRNTIYPLRHPLLYTYVSLSRYTIHGITSLLDIPLTDTFYETY